MINLATGLVATGIVALSLESVGVALVFLASQVGSSATHNDHRLV
jgi:hypothetical protein